jgi:Fe-S cluster assembly protein SufD
VIEIMVEDGAHLRYDSVQDLGAKAWQLGYQLASVGRDATLTSFSASLGGDYSRLYTHAALVGEAAHSKLFAAYLGVGSQVQEFRTFQDHVVGRTKSELVFKGAVADEARSVYSGMIHMRKGARRSEASQTNRNLVLSEGAHADSVPNLDIEENDVRCSHASAVGPIDPDQRFYLESRGIPPEVAERLILLGFFDDLLSKANASGCADYVRRIVADRLSIATYAEVAS